MGHKLKEVLYLKNIYEKQEFLAIIVYPSLCTLYILFMVGVGLVPGVVEII